MTLAQFKQFLIEHPIILHRLCSNLGIRTIRTVYKPRLNYYDTQRLLSSSTTNGFSVTFEVDDDDLTPVQKKLHYADLADKCIKKLKAKGFDTNEE